MAVAHVRRIGDPPFRFASLLHSDSQGGVPALFAGRQVSFSFNARVAIRQIPSVLGLKPGDEVLIPAYNCGSEVDALIHAGLTVRLYPISARTDVDPSDIERLITPRTKAIYFIHYFGFLQPHAAALRALCDRHGLALIEDCALSLLSGSTPAEGRTGDVSVFCFYKFFPVLAGGALVLNSINRAEEVLFGRAPPTSFMLKQILRSTLGPALRATGLRKNRRSSLPAVGDGHMRPDMPAHYYFDSRFTGTRMIGLTKRALRSFDVAAAISARRVNYSRYLQRLADVPQVTPLFPDLGAGACPLNLPLLVRDRNGVASSLVARGVSAIPWWAGYHRKLDWSSGGDATSLKDHVVALPCHQFMDVADVDYAAEQLCDVIKRGPNS